MYEVSVLDIHSDITIENSYTELQYRLATGQTVDSFYYDMEVGKATWWYCGKSYALCDIFYDVVTLANDHSGFCGYYYGSDKVDIYNETGELILSYYPEYDGEIPDSFNAERIRYIFMNYSKAWWLFDGKIRSIDLASRSEKLVIGFHSSLYIKEMNRLSDTVYDPYGRMIYTLSQHPLRLVIGNAEIPVNSREVKVLILERYDLIAVCAIEDYFISSITLYDFDGRVHATIPLPVGTVAFHSVKLLEHTDVPVIVCFEELPGSGCYYTDAIANSKRPNMPIKLQWYELLPDANGQLAMYKSVELYQGYRDIDTSTLEDRHISWR